MINEQIIVDNVNPIAPNLIKNGIKLETLAVK